MPTTAVIASTRAPNATAASSAPEVGPGYLPIALVQSFQVVLLV